MITAPAAKESPACETAGTVTVTFMPPPRAEPMLQLDEAVQFRQQGMQEE